MPERVLHRSTATLQLGPVQPAVSQRLQPAALSHSSSEHMHTLVQLGPQYPARHTGTKQYWQQIHYRFAKPENIKVINNKDDMLLISNNTNNNYNNNNISINNNIEYIISW